MINIPSSTFTLIPLILLLFTLVDTTYLINQTCLNSSMDDPNINCHFCITAFRSAPSSLDANLTRLGLISINLVKHKVNSTTFLIKTLLDNKVDNCTKEGLQDCLELYSNSLPMVCEAARDYRGRRFNGANVKVSSIMDASTTCEDGFEDVGVVRSPLTKQNNDTFQLSAIALSIMNMLH